MNVKHIAQGFLNLAFSIIMEKEGEVLEIASGRLETCSTCTHRVNARCGMCGCYLPALVRSNKGCPLKKFNK